LILINKKQVILSEIGKTLGVTIPLDKILKKPLFEINPELIYKDPANGPMSRKNRQGMEFPAEFRVRKANGEVVEIRYCTNATPDKATEGRTEKYVPKKVQFDGKAVFLAEDQDKAVYYYLHFFNKQSPFRLEGQQYFNKPFEYEFQNDEAKANAQIAILEARIKATNHASQVPLDEMIVLAKGLRIGGVHAMEPIQVRAAMMQFANDNPKLYMEKIQSTVNQVEGLILDGIDKGIFVLDQGQNIKRWKWALGPKMDQLIVELPTSVGNTHQALITHVQQMPGVLNEFLPALMETRKGMAAKVNITKELEGVDVLAMMREASREMSPREYERQVMQSPVPDVQGDKIEVNDIDNGAEITELPTDYKSAQAFLGVHIGKKTPALASKFIEEIKNGNITLENINEALEGFKMEANA